MILNCCVCNSEFSGRPGNFGGSNRSCSPTCSQEYARQKTKRWYAENRDKAAAYNKGRPQLSRAKPPVERECVVCGTTFLAAGRKKGVIRGQQAKTCSEVCGKKLLDSRLTKQRSTPEYRALEHQWRDARKARQYGTRKCEICGVPWSLDWPNGSHSWVCSTACRQQSILARRRERYRLAFLAYETVLTRCPGLDLKAIDREIYGRTRSNTWLGPTALKVIKQLGLLDDLRRDLAAKGPEWEPGTLRRCENCGVQFVGSGPVKTCSFECGRLVVRRKQNNKKGRKTVPVEPMLLTARKCEVCGGSFTTTVRRKVTCSPKCSRTRKNSGRYARRIKARKRRLAGETQKQSTAKHGSPQWQNLSLTT